MIENVDPKVLAAGASFLVGAFDAFRRYRKHEKVQLSKLPLVELRALAKLLRKQFFTIEKPPHDSFVANKTVSSLTKTLGKQGVKPDHLFSYRYSGEVYNATMYFYDSDKRYPHRQIHVRAFPHVEGLEIMAHEEPHWFHHPVAHVRSGDMEHKNANEWTKQRLENQVPVGYPSD